MNLLRGIKHFSAFDNGTVATIGNFDGVHLGHQHLIQKLKNKANSLNLPLVVILFEPQPREHFEKNAAPARLSNLREKLNILRQCEIDYVYVIKFDGIMAQTTAEDFVRLYLVNTLKVKYLLVGEDFKWGKNREGDVNFLQHLSKVHSFDVDVYFDLNIQNERVSSTKIRSVLKQGDLNHAATLLGRTYSICGRVIRGDGRGRQWGIPTANLSLHRLSLPLHGVFVVQVQLASRMIQGVANLGKRPTVDGTKSILEVHLFDFDESIYGELLQVFFLHKLRDEVKFTSVETLISQIHSDIAAAKAFLNLNSQLEARFLLENRQQLNDFVE